MDEDLQKLIEEQKSDIKNGLSSEEAKTRLNTYGLNKLAQKKEKGTFYQIFRAI